MKSKTKQLTQTALLLALAVGFQNLRLLPFLAPALPYSSFVIGSLVNLSIIVAVGTVGIWGSVTIAILAAVLAFLQGFLQFPLFVPIIAIGNMVIPLTWHFFSAKKKYISQFISVVVGSVVKFLFLWWAIPFAFQTFISSTLPEAKATAMLKTLSFTFGYPQFITAMIGGCLAIVIIRMLPKE